MIISVPGLGRECAGSGAFMALVVTMGGGSMSDPGKTGRAEGGEIERMFPPPVLGELSENSESVRPINPHPNAPPDQIADPAPAHGLAAEIDPDEIIAMLLSVMRGSLDGCRTTTSERIRAGTLLMRWLLDGDAAQAGPVVEDELSRAIDDYYRERERDEDEPEPN